MRQSKELNFRGQNIYVGIDVHLKSWSVTVLSENVVLKKFSQNPVPEALHKFLVTNNPGANYHSVYEAGFCGFWIHNALLELGINNIVVNPGDVPTMSKEKLRKTDAVDCGKLARGLRAGDLQGIYVPSKERLEIRSLIRLRSLIVKDITREKNRIKAILNFYGIKLPSQFDSPYTHWSKRFLLWLQEIEFTTEYGRQLLDLHIEQLVHLCKMLLQETRAIRSLSRKSSFAEPLRLITSIPGIGITTGILFLTEIDDIARF
jgi:transposase